MNKNELINKLKRLQRSNDYEMSHVEADKLLLLFINDPEIKKEFGKIGKYYG